MTLNNAATSRLLGTILNKWLVLSLTLLAHTAFALDAGLEAYGKDLGGVRHVNATEAADILQKFPSVKILDVRTGKEFKAGHISDATNIDYYSSSFKTELDKLDKNITWLLHCRSGARSGRSLPILKSLGFKSIIHMDGGILAWEKGGLPTMQ